MDMLRRIFAETGTGRRGFSGTLRFFCALLFAAALLLPAPARAAEGDLLLETAFDTAGELPEGWFAEAWYDGAGEYDIRMEDGGLCIESPAENDVRLCHTIPVERDTCYTIACEIKTEDVAGGQGANVSVRENTSASAAMLGTQDWQRVELTGRTGRKQEELTVCVRLGGYGALASGKAYFRNFTLMEAADTAQALSFAAAEASADDITAGKVPHFGAILLTAFASALAAVFIGRFVIARREEGAGAAQGDTRGTARLVFLLAAAFLLRALLSKIFYGHPTDMGCFMGWGSAIANEGFAAFYTSGMFADYPPGYMYVLGLMAKLAELLGLSYASDAYVFCVKLPAILCDLASAFVVYRMAIGRYGEKKALWLCALMAFNPAAAFLSGGWGQIDSVLTLLLLWSFLLFEGDRRIAAAAVYSLAVLVKPQALMFGPLYAAAYLCGCKNKREWGRTALAVGAAFGVIFLLSLPFKSTQDALWIVEKYFSTATSYPYASVEAFNLMALLGGNWAFVDEKLLFFSYRSLGTVLIVLSVAFCCFLYIRAREKQGALCLCMAAMAVSLFTLGHYMHERYLFPALLLLLIAFVQSGDRRFYTAFALCTLSLLLNAAAAFVITGKPECRGAQYDALTYMGSLLSLSGWAYLLYAAYGYLLAGKKAPAFVKTEEAGGHAMPLPPPDEAEEAMEGGRIWTRRDRLLCGLLSLVYAVVAFVNLGTLDAPENGWRAGAGDTAQIHFDEAVEIADIWAFGAIAEGSARITLDDGQSFSYEQLYDYMFLWQRLGYGGVTQTLSIEVQHGEIWLQELAVLDAAGRPIACTFSDAPALVDEADTVPEAPSNENGMFFDELYHGRTAFEHLHGLEPYENSHPPLGKILIMGGVALFGMNPFGWRFAGCLLGVAMLPIFYALAKAMFKRTEYAFLSAGLLAADFMHFTQTRIATIDVFAVFFILLMYACMYRYMQTDFLRDGVKNTLLPLGLGGLFFGLGAASKWTCIYAGGGLALLLLLHLIRLYKKSRRAAGDETAGAGAAYWKGVLRTLLWCCLFYAAIPIGVYVASYTPYFLCETPYDLEGVWGLQEFMFSYHSGLTATHPYQSAWWEWPLDLRPVWYYVGYSADGTRAGTISAFGNPAIWWTCSGALAVLIVLLVSGRIRNTKETELIACGAAANYLPWVLVPRCTFAYHYFPMVPFIILAAVYLLRLLEARGSLHTHAKWLWLGLCALLFMLFYPVLSGLMAPTGYIKALEWLPGWTFLGY